MLPSPLPFLLLSLPLFSIFLTFLTLLHPPLHLPLFFFLTLSYSFFFLHLPAPVMFALYSPPFPPFPLSLPHFPRRPYPRFLLLQVPHNSLSPPPSLPSCLSLPLHFVCFPPSPPSYILLFLTPPTLLTSSCHHISHCKSSSYRSSLNRSSSYRFSLVTISQPSSR